MRTDRPTRLLSNGSGAVIVRALALSLDCPEPLRAGGDQTPGQDDPDGAGSRDQATPLGECPADGEWLGIRLKLGTVLPLLPARTPVGAAATLPEATSSAVWLGGSAWHVDD